MVYGAARCFCGRPAPGARERPSDAPPAPPGDMIGAGRPPSAALSRPRPLLVQYLRDTPGAPSLEREMLTDY